jgi:hypothetical protein
MRILLITPPMTQINTPYPATAYLTGFLSQRGYAVSQADLGLELLLRLLSRNGIRKISAALKISQAPSVQHFLKNVSRYENTVDSVVRFLQGNDPTLAHRLCSSGFIPMGPRFQSFKEMETSPEGLHWAFGSLGLQDRAKYVASLYVDDLNDVIRDGIDSRFELSRYAEKLAASAPTFDPIRESLHDRNPTLVDQMLDELTTELFKSHSPNVVGLSLPFPGNVYGGFRIAKRLKEINSEIKIIVGGGYVNTELREISDVRVFDYIDYLTLDDGEGPFLSVLEHISGKFAYGGLMRTFLKENNVVVFKNDLTKHDIPFKDAGTPLYEGLPLGKYLSLCELLNPMHRLWSDGRWNKLTLAHGCYWKKCSFCDTSLDYIGRYQPQPADLIVDRIQEIIAKTGQTGFHFVDEAAPPKVLRAMAEKLIERGVTITWWGNIRFEKAFTAELTDLLARSGCIAVSGGLEVASDRLLALMEKGMTVEQVARVTNAFTQSGIMVHSYLMYGFPSQTVGETIDSLERVRQLFAAGCIQSAFWHRFSVTVHSPVGLNPERYGIRLMKGPSTFAQNDIPFEDTTGIDHGTLSAGLKKAVYNYMHGLGLDEDVRSWFDFPVPKAKVSKSLIESALREKPAVHSKQH